MEQIISCRTKLRFNSFVIQCYAVFRNVFSQNKREENTIGKSGTTKHLSPKQVSLTPMCMSVVLIVSGAKIKIWSFSFTQTTANAILFSQNREVFFPTYYSFIHTWMRQKYILSVGNATKLL